MVELIREARYLGVKPWELNDRIERGEPWDMYSRLARRIEQDIERNRAQQATLTASLEAYRKGNVA
jgi:hypothetical protein